MRVWMLFVQGDGATWLEGAWDDESTVDNHAGWQEEVGRVAKLAFENGYEYRVVEVIVPGVHAVFEPVKATAEIAGSSLPIHRTEEERHAGD